MRYRQPVWPAILTGDVVAILLGCCILREELAWGAWLAFMVGFDLMLYFAFRDRPPKLLRTMRQSRWVGIKRRYRSGRNKVMKVLLVEASAAGVGYLIGLDVCSGMLYMSIVNMLLCYWHLQSPSMPIVPGAHGAAAAAAAAGAERLRQIRQWQR